METTPTQTETVEALRRIEVNLLVRNVITDLEWLASLVESGLDAKRVAVRLAAAELSLSDIRRTLSK